MNKKLSSATAAMQSATRAVSVMVTDEHAMDDLQARLAGKVGSYVQQQGEASAPRARGPVQRRVHAVVSHRFFTRFILFFILLSMGAMALDAPYSWYMAERPWLEEFLYVIEIVCTCVFTVEAAMQFVAAGPRRYLMSPILILELVVVISSWVALIRRWSGATDSIGGGFLVLRVLRPVKLLARIPSMKLVLGCLGIAILDLGSVLTIMFYYFVACGLMSVQLFGGRLAQRCQDGDSGEWLIDTYYDNCGLPGTMGRQCDEIASELWAAGEYPPNATAAILAANATGELIEPFVANVSCVSTWGMPSVEEFFKADDLLKFDSIGWAVLTLFLCMSGVGWTDVMYKLIDVRGWPVAIYFTLFVTAGMWGVTNLLVAVLSNAYEDMHAQAVYDEKQERIRRHRDKTLGPPPPKLGDRILEVCKRMHLGPLNEEGRKRRRHLRRIVVSRGFDIMVTVVVVANVGLIAIHTPFDDQVLSDAYQNADWAFSGFYLLELMIKVAALGFWEYVADPSDLFDAFLVGVSILDLALYAAGVEAAALTFLRVLRVVRVFKAAGKLQAFRKIVASIVRSAMSVASMGVLLLLFIYSSAIVGMQLMQGAWPRDERPRFHFDNFPSAFVTVWCVVTTEEWNIIMMEAYSVVGWWAIFYFVAVVIVGNFIFLNMFLAILLGNMMIQGDEERAEAQTAAAAEAFRTAHAARVLCRQLERAALRRRAARAATAMAALDMAAEDVRGGAPEEGGEAAPTIDERLSRRAAGGGEAAAEDVEVAVVSLTHSASFAPSEGSVDELLRAASATATAAAAHPDLGLAPAAAPPRPLEKMTVDELERELSALELVEALHTLSPHPPASPRPPTSPRRSSGEVSPRSPEAKSGGFRKIPSGLVWAQERSPPEPPPETPPETPPRPERTSNSPPGSAATLPPPNRSWSPPPSPPAETSQSQRGSTRMSVSERAAACATSTAAAAADGANRKLGRQASFFTKEREGLGLVVQANRRNDSVMTWRGGGMLESFMKRGRGADDEDEGGGFEGVLSSRHRRHASQDVAGGVLGWQQDMGQTEDDVKLDLPYLSGWEVAAFRLKFKKAVADKRHFDDKLLLAELPHFLKNIGHRVDWLPEHMAAELERLMNTFDADGDGKLSEQELLRLINEKKRLEVEEKNRIDVGSTPGAVGRRFSQLLHHERPKDFSRVLFMEKPLQETTCGCLDAHSPFRRWAQKLHYSRWLRLITLLSIFASGAMVGIGLKQETSDAERIMGSDRFAAMLLTVDISFLLLLFVDLLVLVTSFGLFSDPVHGALRPRHRMWFVVDCLVLVGTLVILCIPPLPPSSEGARTIKFVKSARLLCIVSRVKEMRSMFHALVAAFSRVLPVMLTWILMLLVFGVSSVVLFGGRLGYCADGAGRHDDNLVHLWPRLPVSAAHDRTECDAGAAAGQPWAWVAFRPNFDNTGMAMLGLAQILFLDGWSRVLYQTLDMRGVEEQPAEEAQWWPIVFFVVYTVVGSLFIFNLFIGAVISTFEELYNEQHGMQVLTEEQAQWVHTQRIMQAARPPPVLTPPYNNFRFFCFRVVTAAPPVVSQNIAEIARQSSATLDGTEARVKKVTKRSASAHLAAAAARPGRYYGKWFNGFFTALVVINTLLLLAYTPGRREKWIIYSYSVANVSFNMLFGIEASFKLVGLGPRQYLRDAWNRFDLFLVLCSMTSALAFTLDFFLGAGTSPLNLGFLRTVRVLRLAQRSRSFRKLLLTLRLGLPSLLNITLLLAIFIYWFAMLGMILLGGALPSNECGVSRHANFDAVFISLLALYRFATGDAWACFYLDAQEAATFGRYAPGVLPPSIGLVHVYFLIFMLVSLMMITVFMAILLQYYDIQQQLIVSSAEVRQYAEIWATFDPDGTDYMPVRALGALLLSLRPPLVCSIDGGNKRHLTTPLPVAQLEQLLLSLHIPVRLGSVHFMEVLAVLTSRLTGTALPDTATLVKTSLLGHWPRAMPSLLRLPPADGTSSLYTHDVLHELGLEPRLPPPPGARSLVASPRVSEGGVTLAAASAGSKFLRLSRGNTPKDGTPKSSERWPATPEAAAALIAKHGALAEREAAAREVEAAEEAAALEERRARLEREVARLVGLAERERQMTLAAAERELRVLELQLDEELRAIHERYERKRVSTASVLREKLTAARLSPGQYSTAHTYRNDRGDARGGGQRAAMGYGPYAAPGFQNGRFGYL